MGFHIQADLSPWYRLLDRHEYPNVRCNEALNGVFGALAEDVRGRIPILTGSLLNSEKVDAGGHGNEWNGRLEYGGASAGPKPDVVYARQAIFHAGSFDGLEGFDAEFIEAMYANVRGA